MSSSVWQSVQNDFEANLSRGNFMTWIKPTQLLTIENGVATVHAPSVFIREWIETHYRADILMSLQKYDPTVTEIIITVDAPTESSTTFNPTPADPHKPALIETPSEPVAPVMHMTHTEDLIPTVLRTKSDNSPTIVRKQTFATFVEGSNNRLAFNAGLAASKEPGSRYNPLFIYGGVGLGKTHLMHAIANEIIGKDPHKRAIYVSSETFTNDYVEGIRTRKMDAFKKTYRTVDVLLVDDIQFIANKEGSQEEFFNTFNTLHQTNRQIVLAADRPPSAIPGLEERLSSRFNWGMVVDIQAPNLETRMAIVARKSLERNLRLPDSVLEYIASQVQTNIRDLEGALNRVIGFCEMQNLPVSLEAAKGALSGMYTPANRRGVTTDAILEIVAQHFGVTLADLCGKKRQQSLVYARHMAMYVLRDQLGMSYPDIGKEMGGKDHTTIMHGVNKITSERSQSHVSQDLDAIRERLS